MKKIFVLVALAFVLTSCAPLTATQQGFVELPSDAKAGITALVVMAVAWIFAKLIALIPYLKFLEQFREPLSLAIAAELISLIQNAVPDAYGNAAVLAIQLALEIIALYLVFGKLKERGFRLFK